MVKGGDLFREIKQLAVLKVNTAVHMMAHHQLGKKISDAQADAIVAWLKTLTGTIDQDYIKPPTLP